MVNHIVEYDENDEGTRSWAKRSCGDKSPQHRGPASDNFTSLDRWAERHIDLKS